MGAFLKKKKNPRPSHIMCESPRVRDLLLGAFLQVTKFCHLVAKEWGCKLSKGFFFFFFFLKSLVPIKFPICSLSSQCVPQGCSKQHLALIPYVLPKVMPPLLTYMAGPKGKALQISIESSIMGGASIVTTFFCDGPIKITHCKKTKNKKRKTWTCKTPPIL